MAGGICKQYWTVITICEHVIAEDTLTGRNKHIRINKSTQLGIIVAGLEVIQGGFIVVRLATGGNLTAYDKRR